MRKESRSYLEITFRSINCFANDGNLDVDELNSLMDIALRDGVVDENEKRVLRNIMERLKEEELSDAMLDRLQELEDAYGVQHNK